MQTAAPSQVPPELGALLTLVQGLQQGNVAGATPEGQPTVAAQAVQAAQQMGQQQAAQQAALGNQQQMAAQQAAMQQVPQQLQQLEQRQQQLEQGLASAPGAGAVRMAAGGIVGFAEGGETRDPLEVVQEMLARGEEIPPELLRLINEGRQARDRLRQADPNWGWRPSNPVNGQQPQAPGQPIDGSWRENIPELPMAPEAPASERGSAAIAAGGGSQKAVGPMDLKTPGDAAAMYNQARSGIASLQSPVPTQEEILAGAGQQRAADRSWMQQTGNDPDQQAKDIASAQAREQERAAHIAGLEKELAGRGKNAGLIEFLINARGSKGDGIGRPLATGAEAALKGDEGRRRESRTISELKFAYQDAAAKEQAALRAAKLATDMGQKDRAMAELKSAKEFSNAKASALAAMDAKRSEGLQTAETENMKARVDMRAQDIAQRGQNVQLQIAKINAAANDDGLSPKEKAAMAKLAQLVNGDSILKELAKSAAMGLPGAEEKATARFESLVKLWAPEQSVRLPSTGTPSTVKVPSGVTVKRIGS